MKTISDLFSEYWYASKAISVDRYERMVYCKQQFIKDEKLFADYFDSSPKKLWLFINAELVGTY